MWFGVDARVNSSVGPERPTQWLLTFWPASQAQMHRCERACSRSETYILLYGPSLHNGSNILACQPLSEAPCVSGRSGRGVCCSRAHAAHTVCVCARAGGRTDVCGRPRVRAAAATGLGWASPPGNGVGAHMCVSVCTPPCVACDRPRPGRGASPPS